MTSIQLPVSPAPWERKQVACQGRAESSAVFGALFQVAPVGLLITTVKEGRAIQANEAFLTLTGYTREEVIGRTTLEIGLWSSAEQRNTFIKSTSREGITRNQELPFLTKEGQTRVGLFNVEPLPVEDEACLLVMMQDITDRKQAEATLERSQQFVSDLVASIQDGFLALDREWRFTYVNARAAKAIGTTPEALIGKNLWIAFPALTGTAIETHYRTAMQERRAVSFENLGVLTGRNYEIRVYPSAEGIAVYWVDITDRKQAEGMRSWLASFPKLNPNPVVEVDLAGQIDYLNPASKRLIPDLATLGPQHPWLADLVSIGQRLKENEVQSLVREVTLGTVTYQQTMQYVASTQRVRIYAMDITSRKQAEAQMEVALEVMNRYAAELQARNEDLNAFAHTVAHDLKNPLNIVIGYAELLEQDLGSMAEPSEKLATLVNLGARKMARIIDDLLLLAGVGQAEVERSPLDMAAIVAESCLRLTDMLKTYQSEISLPTTWPVALGYAPWIEEVWMNYLSNALKYGGRPARLVLGSDALPAGMVRFWVRDNGHGITPEAQAQLFTAFNTATELRGTGHGVGLSIVRRIVEKLGGQVAAYNNPDGPGSTFSFTLPSANSAAR
jgi:PAS domain S-box-containing protein